MELSACAGAGTAGGACVRAGGCGGRRFPLVVGDPGPRPRGRRRLTGSGRDRLTRLGRGRLGASPGRMVSCPHALSELRSKGGVGTHVVSQPCVAGHTRLVRAPSSYIKLVRGFQEGV